jgi:hypothetical protein
MNATISPSAINTWYTCHFKYYCKYIAKRRTIKTPDTSAFGIALHDIFDHYYDIIPKAMKLEEINEYIEKAFTEHQQDIITRNKADARRSQRSLFEFEEWRISNKIQPPTLKEQFLTAKISDDLPQIRGKPDAYFRDAKLLVDWKSGSHAELTDELKIQGGTYKIMLENNGYPVEKIIFDYVKVGKRITLPQISRQWIESKLRDMVGAINANHFNKMYNPLCRKWCEYKLDCELDDKCIWMIP